MTVTEHHIRPGAYYDSIILMQLQKALAKLPGVVDAGVAMATPANCDLLRASGFELEGLRLASEDLLIVVEAEDRPAAESAIGQVDELLKPEHTTTGRGYRPHSLKGALDVLPEAEWVLVSVPGRYAAAVADEALDRGRHVFLYSDNVSMEDEVRLKQKARSAGQLLMGPDCGTAIINGVGLGFANRVRRGDIGLVAASGTGLQAVSAAIHNQGGGVSQAFGTGGRDLSAGVGGVTALQALDWLARDEMTAVIVLISKPPDPEIASRLLRSAETCRKPVVVNFIGFPAPARQAGNLVFASGLSDAAEQAVRLSQRQAQTQPHGLKPLNGYVRGLFSGGTLAYEMLLGLQAVCSPLYSNLSGSAARKLADPLTSRAHTILDLGEDTFTQGRLHPMLDNDLRLRRLRQESADPQVDLILLDVVLGEGAHPGPAAELGPGIAEAVRAGKRVVTIVIGTPNDPQNLDDQIEQLSAAGSVVLPSVDAALDHIVRRAPPAAYSHPPVAFDTKRLAAINVGLESFEDSILAQEGTAVHVDWRPPAGGNQQLMDILAKLRAPT